MSVVASKTNYPIYMVTVSAPTNIAVIKYWGKANDEYNTPINSSISVTLDQTDLRAVTTVAASVQFTSDRLWLNGIEDTTASTNKRFRACIDGVKSLAGESCELVATDGITKTTITKNDWSTMKIHVSSYNTFPTAAGLASSAAGYAALVAALGQLMNAVETYPGQLSTIARQGSGSACRSLYGGYVAWRQGSPGLANDWADSKAEQIANELYWPEMRTIIVVVSDDKKDTSSTSGMKTSVATSLLLRHRANDIVPQRMINMEDAIITRNFSKFAQLTMQDSNQFHATCLDTYPPIFYMNDTSRLIIRIITAYNNFYGTEKVAYTFDAGPNAVLYTLQDTLIEIGALLLYYFPISTSTSVFDDYIESHSDPSIGQQIQSYQLNPLLLDECNKVGRVPVIDESIKMMYVTKPGPGPQVLSTNDSNLNPVTGENSYHPPTTKSTTNDTKQ